MTKPKPKRARVTAKRMADENHAVLTVEGGRALWRREPCGGCPWRIDQTGAFPAEAFRLSANTSVDMSMNTFACHESGTTAPAICAGFIYKGAANNLAMRLKWMHGKCLDVTDGGHALHESYRAMAMANGVDPDDPALQDVRP